MSALLELWHSTHSTCSQKVRLALEEKGLAWTGHPLNLRRFDQLNPQFLALNPAGLVPVVRHDGRVIVESRIINEYIEDAWPAVPLAPTEPHERARMRQWTRYSDEVLTHAIKLPSFAKNIAPELQRMDPAEVAAMVARIPDPGVRALAARVGAGHHTRGTRAVDRATRGNGRAHGRRAERRPLAHRRGLQSRRHRCRAVRAAAGADRSLSPGRGPPARRGLVPTYHRAAGLPARDAARGF